MTTTLSQYLARHRKSRKHFSALHADFLQEIQVMPTPVSSNNLSTHGSSPVKVQFGREQTVADQGRQAEPANADQYSGTARSAMGVSTQVGPIVVKPVGHNALEGSHKGDYRRSGDTAKASMDKIANPPAPREQMRGQQNSKHYQENGRVFVSNEFASSDSDAGN
jgi:hypothetical protein